MLQTSRCTQNTSRESKLQLGYICFEGNGKNDNYLVIYVSKLLLIIKTF